MIGSVRTLCKLLDPLSLVCTLIDFNADWTDTFTYAAITFSLYCTHRCVLCKRSEKCCQPAAVCDVSECAISWWVVSHVMFGGCSYRITVSLWGNHMIGCVLVSCQNSVGPLVYFLYESNVRIFGVGMNAKIWLWIFVLHIRWISTFRKKNQFSYGLYMYIMM